MEPTPIPLPTYTVRLGGTTVPYTIRRSTRAKHVRITISAHNGVSVIIPARIKRYVNPDDFLREKEEWVLRHLPKAMPARPVASRLESGAKLSLHGNEYTLAICNCSVQRPEIRIAGSELRVDLPVGFSGELKETIKRWMRERAAEVIGDTAETIAREMGVRFSGLAVRDQKTKWGSCSRKRNLSFNWRLVLFPPDVMRYVVVHELCHIRQFNHSSKFWALVERYDPHYKDSIAWLKKHGTQIEGALR